MGTYAWNILYSKILPAKSRDSPRRPATQATPSQAVHRNLATGPNIRVTSCPFSMWDKVYSILTSLHQSGQITGSGTVPNLVQVYRIRYIQSHNASDTPKLFQISNWKIKEKFRILLKVFTTISFYALKIIVSNIKQSVTVPIKYILEN